MTNFSDITSPQWRDSAAGREHIKTKSSVNLVSRRTEPLCLLDAGVPVFTALQQYESTAANINYQEVECGPVLSLGNLSLRQIQASIAGFTPTVTPFGVSATGGNIPAYIAAAASARDNGRVIVIDDNTLQDRLTGSQMKFVSFNRTRIEKFGSRCATLAFTEFQFIISAIAKGTGAAGGCLTVPMATLVLKGAFPAVAEFETLLSAAPAITWYQNHTQVVNNQINQGSLLGDRYIDAPATLASTDIIALEALLRSGFNDAKLSD